MKGVRILDIMYNAHESDKHGGIHVKSEHLV